MSVATPKIRSMNAHHARGLKLLFGDNYSNWSYGDFNLSMATPWNVSRVISEVTTKIYPCHDYEGQYVFDMFGGLGIDTICLSKYYRVLTTEIDETTYKSLVANCSIFPECKDGEIKNIDCIKFASSISQRDVKPHFIFFDPPWGDNFNSRCDNFDFTNVMLPNGLYIVSILDKLLEITPNIVIKTSLKSSTFELRYAKRIAHVMVFQKQKLKFIFLR